MICHNSTPGLNISLSYFFSCKCSSCFRLILACGSYFLVIVSLLKSAALWAQLLHKSAFFVDRHIGPQQDAPNENEFGVNRRSVEILKCFVQSLVQMKYPVDCEQVVKSNRLFNRGSFFLSNEWASLILVQKSKVWR